ncbi:MAG: hypothetical protein M3P12_10315 [Gemmatimonadota bacterium]|nr:hypothetical protein [Gemmatimonadota bacterium]
MRPIVVRLTLLLAVAACETSTDPFIGFGGTPEISQAQATGNWSFTVQRTSTLGCTAGSLADGQVLTATLNVLADGTLATATSSWQNPPTTVVRPLSGSVNLTSGFTDLFMAASTGSSAAMELRGTMTSTGSFSGTLTDPAPGSFQVFGACSYTAAGNKTS